MKLLEMNEICVAREEETEKDITGFVLLFPGMTGRQEEDAAGVMHFLRLFVVELKTIVRIKCMGKIGKEGQF